MGRYRSREYQEEVGFSQPSYHNLGFLSEKPYILNCNYCKQKIDGGGILDRDVIRSLQELLSQSEFILGKPGLYDNYVLISMLNCDNDIRLQIIFTIYYVSQ